MTALPAQKILQAVRSRREEMIDFLARLVALETPSNDAVAQAPAFEMIGGALGELGFQTRLIAGKRYGGSLYARPPRPRGAGTACGSQMLIGHCDTIWAAGTVATMPVVVESNRMRGPGVFDMKGGLTQALFALRVLDDLQLEPPLLPIVFINSDEEIGSDESCRWIERLARVMERVYVMEPSLTTEGLLKTARKGVARYIVTAHGRAAHAGLDPQGGASAILEMGRAVESLFALNDYESGLTVNVGTIEGGTAENVIAACCSARVDVRVPTCEDARKIDAVIRNLSPTVPGVRLEIHNGQERRPLERTPANRVLWGFACEAAEALGIELGEGTAGGGSDGNITSQYTATLDGLGAVGDGAHADHEYVDLDRMVERTALLAMLIMAPSAS